MYAQATPRADMKEPPSLPVPWRVYDTTKPGRSRVVQAQHAGEARAAGARLFGVSRLDVRVEPAAS